MYSSVKISHHQDNKHVIIAIVFFCPFCCDPLAPGNYWSAFLFFFFNFKCVFMGALRNSIILSFLCNNISSTEAPGDTATTPKLKSHRWYANTSISQLSISYLREASTPHRKRSRLRARARRVDALVKLVAGVIVPSHGSASPSWLSPARTQGGTLAKVRNTFSKGPVGGSELL